jgi:hypothetical protein
MQSAALNPNAPISGTTDVTVPISSQPEISPARRWTGRILTGVSVAFLALDGLMKVVEAAPVVQGSAELGYPLSTMAPIGIALLVSTALYLIPRTAFFGALLLTGYMGGAVATHVRVLHPLFSHTLFPVYVSVLIWAGLALRDRRLDALIRQVFTARAG